MTEEERAEEYVDALLNKDDAEINKFLDEKLGDLQLNERQAGTLLGIIKGIGICSFLAGHKAGKDMAEADLSTIAYMQGAERFKTKWHKVADGDYPAYEKGGFTVNVFTDRGEIAYYNYDEECWVAEPASVEIDPPVAWCEIPKFEE